MAIDYDADILTFFGGSVDPDEPYASVPAALKDEDAEKRILTTAEVVRAHMDTLTSRTESRLLHFCISRMISRIGSGGFVFDSLDAEIVGNVRDPLFEVGDTITTDEDGDVNVITVDGPGLDVVTVAAEITAGTVAIAASRSQNGRLVMTSEESFSVTAGVIADKAGIPRDTFFSRRERVANEARDDAVEFYVAVARDETL